MTAKFDKELTQTFIKMKRTFPVINTAQDDSVLHHVGDVRGKKVLDLGCGEGSCARLMKIKGADLVVGVDLSEHIIKLAREEETNNPMGIEYFVKDGRTMEKIGEFDIVVGNLLLYYAENEEQLQGFADAIYKNLVPGGKFVSYTFNVTKTKWSPSVRQTFPYNIKELREAPNGWWVRIGNMPSASVKIDFTVLFLHSDIYERVFAKAGFIYFSFHPPFLSKASIDSFPKGYWDPLMNDPIFHVITARK